MDVRDVPHTIWIQQETNKIPLIINSKPPKLVLDSAPNAEDVVPFMHGELDIPFDLMMYIFSYLPADALLVPDILLVSKSIFKVFTESPSSYQFVLNQIIRHQDIVSKIMLSIFTRKPELRNVAEMCTSAFLRFNRLKNIWTEVGQYSSRIARVNLNFGCSVEDLEKLRLELEKFYSTTNISLPIDVLFSWSIHDGESGGNNTPLGVGLASSTMSDMPCVIGFARLLSIQEIILTLQIYKPSDYKQMNNLNETLYLLPVSIIFLLLMF
jgi:hypothetical protein